MVIKSKEPRKVMSHKDPISALADDLRDRADRWLKSLSKMAQGQKLSVDDVYEFIAITTQSLVPIGLILLGAQVGYEAYKKWQESQKKK